MTYASKAPEVPPVICNHYWDTVFVRRLGTRADDVSRELIAGISDRDRRAWSGGSPADWAKESFRIAKDHVYGPLRHTGGTITLGAQYQGDADSIVAGQLRRRECVSRGLLNDAAAPGACGRGRAAGVLTADHPGGDIDRESKDRHIEEK